MTYLALENIHHRHNFKYKHNLHCLLALLTEDVLKADSFDKSGTADTIDETDTSAIKSVVNIFLHTTIYN